MCVVFFLFFVFYPPGAVTTAGRPRQIFSSLPHVYLLFAEINSPRIVCNYIPSQEVGTVDLELYSVPWEGNRSGFKGPI